MNILIYGEPYEWAMAPNLKEALEALGHRAEVYDWTRFLYRARGLTWANRVRDRLLRCRTAGAINADFLHVLDRRKCDVLIVLKGCDLFPATIVAAKKRVGRVVNWNPDDFFNPLNSTRHLVGSFDKFDCIFTPRGHLVEEYYRKGARRVEVIDWYYLPRFQRPVAVSPEDVKSYGGSVAFVGSWSPRRERLLGALGHLDLRIWGGGWSKAAGWFRRTVSCRPPLFGERMAKVFCCTPINLNVLTRENRDTTNVRNFEIAACAGFQLSERSAPLLNLFAENEEIACFDGAEELASQCRYYLDHGQQRRRIAHAGYRRLKQGHHTMLDRAKQILDVLAGS